LNPILFEKIIIKLLFVNIKVRDKVLPFLKESIFDNEEHKKIIKKILEFYDKHTKFPTIADIRLKIEGDDVSVFQDIIDCSVSEYTEDELFEGIEQFFKEKLVHGVNVNIMDKLIEGKVNECYPYVDDLREALSFSFDTSIGVDVLEDGKKFYEHLHSAEKFVPTGIPTLDYFLQGGLYEKTLTLLMANSNMGKSLVMGSLATNMLLNNKKVLIVSLEMSEFKYDRRILGNLFDIEINNLKNLSEADMMALFEEKRKIINSKMIIKEFPTKSINTNNIRNLLTNLELKKKFVPDIIFVDYLEIMKANHTNKNGNSFEEIKKISEDLRGLGGEKAIPIFSGTQTNRQALGSPELGVEDMSQSIGPLFTADTLLGLTQPEEYAKISKFLLHILKHRDGEKNKKITLDVNYSKMRISDDVETNKQLKEIPITKKESAIGVVGRALNLDNQSKKSNNFEWE
jgi:archaellum biogenesis ATPase FlaH